jgi:hypothetical protein
MAGKGRARIVWTTDRHLPCSVWLNRTRYICGGEIKAYINVMLAGQASICAVLVNRKHIPWHAALTGKVTSDDRSADSDEPDIMEVSINDEHPPTPVSAAVVKVADGAATADLEDQADMQSSIARLGELTVESPSAPDISVTTQSMNQNVGVELRIEASHNLASFSSSGSATPSDDDSISESDGEECMPNDGHDLIDDSDDDDQDGLESHGKCSLGSHRKHL